MIALRKHGYDANMLSLDEIPVPKAGPGDVVIKVKAAGICGSDLPLRYGKVEGKTVDYPIVIGHEFAGEIAEVGEGVTRWKVGDRVVSDNSGYVCGTCHACASGQYLFCANRKGMGNDMDGGFAEYVKIPAQVLQTFPNCLYRIPDGVPYDHAAILDPCCNAYKALVQEAKLLPGETVVIFGAGALGLFCVQIASIIGAGQIIVVGLQEDVEARFPIARELGATHTIASDSEDLQARIAELVNKDDLAVVVDCAGAPEVFENSIGLLRNGGKFVRIGYSKRPMGFSLDTMGLKGIVAIGHMGYDSTSWRNSINLLKNGRVAMDKIISHRMPLKDWDEGFELVRSKKATKVILIPEE